MQHVEHWVAQFIAAIIVAVMLHIGNVSLAISGVPETPGHDVIVESWALALSLFFATFIFSPWVLGALRSHRCLHNISWGVASISLIT